MTQNNTDVSEKKLLKVWFVAIMKLDFQVRILSTFVLFIQMSKQNLINEVFNYFYSFYDKK